MTGGMWIGPSLGVTSTVIEGGGNGASVRGLSQGMHVATQFLDGSAAWSSMTRTGHRSRKRFRRSKVVYPTFMLTGSNPIIESDLALSFKLQVAIEPEFHEGLSSIPVRNFQYSFDGDITGLYDGPGTNDQGYIVSDWLEHDWIEADQKFGIWTAIENQLGASSPSGTLPVTNNISSYINRNEGFVSNIAGNAGISWIDTHAVTDRTVMNAFFNTQAGGAEGFWPCMMLIEYENNDVSVAIWGDSIGDGVGEGVSGSGTTASPPIYGDTMGSLRRNKGYFERALDEYLEVPMAINLSKGSDGYRYAGLTATSAQKRMNLLRLANPTHVWMGYIHNDIAALTTVTFQTQAATLLNQITSSLPDAKIIHSLCTPDATDIMSISSLTSVGTLCTATVASTEYLVSGQTVTIAGASPSTYNGDFAITIVDGTTLTYTAASAPATTPATGTIQLRNGFTNENIEVVSPNFGNSSSKRGQFNNIVRTKTGPFAIVDTIFDPNPTVEYGYNGTQASETSKWKPNADRRYALTWDGTHPNSLGADTIAAAIPDDFIQS